MTDTMILLVVALLFIVSHLGISSTPLRSMMVNVLGENGYLGVYSLISLAVIGWLSYIYAGMAHADFLWLPGLVTSAVAKSLMPLSLLLIATGAVAKNPTSMKMESALNEEAGGILRITRHPVQWGILIWALSHMIANGDVASLIFFGSFAVISGIGTVLMDRKLAIREGDRWQSFEAVTSNIPFAAIISGRNRLQLNEIGWKTPVAGLAIFTLLYWFHDLFTGIALFAL